MMVIGIDWYIGINNFVQVESPPEVLYHMTTAAEWDEAKAKGHAYYPKTFEADGDYTHATGVPSRLIETANHFYQVHLCFLINWIFHNILGHA